MNAGERRGEWAGQRLDHLCTPSPHTCANLRQTGFVRIEQVVAGDPGEVIALQHLVARADEFFVRLDVRDVPPVPGEHHAIEKLAPG